MERSSLKFADEIHWYRTWTLPTRSSEGKKSKLLNATSEARKDAPTTPQPIDPTSIFEIRFPYQLRKINPTKGNNKMSQLLANKV